MNAYGPAEASDDVAQHRMTCAPTTPYVPVGKPIRNVRLYVVDPQMNQPDRDSRRAVSGVAVGRGYLNNEAATRRSSRIRSIRRAFACTAPATSAATCPMERSCSTAGPPAEDTASAGDRQRAGRHSGNPPGGGRSTIATRPAARVARMSRSRRRVAERRRDRRRVVRDAAGLHGARHLRGARRAPLSGKIDRKALPPLDRARLAATAHAPTPPRTPTEMCRIWGEALGIPSPGIHDNLFALGGDSILRYRVAGREGGPEAHHPAHLPASDGGRTRRRPRAARSARRSSSRRPARCR